MKRIALFGGSFDPIHVGHTLVAQEAMQQLQADRVIFIPTKQSPLKTRSPRAGNAHRFNMIQHAIEGVTGFEVNDCEFNRPAPSFTLDTVLHLKPRLPLDADLFWLIGADTLNELPHWYRMDELLKQCHLAIMLRGGYEKPDFSTFAVLWGEKQVEKLKENMVQTSRVELSSSEIRHRLLSHQDVTGLLHPTVLQYINQHRLYGA